MGQFVRTRIRCALYPSKVGESFLNVFTNAAPKIYKGGGVDFEIGIFDSANVLFDVANIVDLTLLVQPVGRASNYILKTVAPSGNISLADWQSGIAQHGVISLLGSETSIAVGTHELTIWGHTNDAGSDPDIFGTSRIEVLDAGITVVTQPAVVPNYPTNDQLGAALAGVVRFNGNPPGAKIQLRSPSGLKFATFGADNEGNPDLGSTSTT